MYLENNTFKAQKFGRSRIAQQTLLVCNVNMAATRDTGRLNRGNTSSLMSDYPRYKALWFFKNVLDADGNGYANQDDFIRIALKHAVFFCKGGYFKDIYETYVSTFQKIWQELSKDADTNQDGVIGVQEWYEYIDRLRSSFHSFDQLPEYLRELIEHHFNSYDLNRDGFIDVNEYRLYLCGRNMDLKMATACFDSLFADADRSKATINKKQFCDLMFDYLFSTKPGSRGTYICGPLNGIKKTAIDLYAHLAGL